MKAKEMLEQLDFEFLSSDEYCIRYMHKETDEMIWFHKKVPTYESDVFEVTMPLQKAINQQLREMGYLE